LFGEREALAQIRASKPTRPGTQLVLDDGTVLDVGVRDAEGFYHLALTGDDTLDAVLGRAGHVPLPPYIDRPDTAADAERYQTVYAQVPGAVAAPTAGLHFDEDLIARVRALGVAFGRITLHVGAGTFQPVRVDDLAEHRMHAEWLRVDAALCAQVAAARARGGRIVAVGTTSVRALETAAVGGALAPFAGETRLFITPGYRFRVVDALITNFHLPESTLLMLVCAFGGYDRVMRAYRHAIAEQYRFYSYGDAMWLTPRSPSI
jgi:S-adenosylmethionine:tRNA ribosyltransferase-isomerase